MYPGTLLNNCNKFKMLYLNLFIKETMMYAIIGSGFAACYQFVKEEYTFPYKILMISAFLSVNSKDKVSFSGCRLEYEFDCKS